MSSPTPPCDFFCLVVEDCDADYLTLERFVQRSSFPVGLRRCVEADEVIALLQEPASPAEPKAAVPAVIVLDLGLSGAGDGRAVLQQLRRHPSLKRTPIVVFSSSTNPSDIDWCYRNGANAYQVKNIGFASFKCVAEMLVNYWRGTGVPALKAA